MKRLLLAALFAAPASGFAQNAPAPSAPATQTDALDRSTPVPPGPAREFQVPPLAEATLKDGMKLALEEVSRLPIVSVRLILPFGGSAFEPDGKAGLSDIVAQMLQEGTRALPGAKFGERLEELGAQLNVDVRPDAMIVTLFTTKENLDQALGLVSQMLREPQLSAPDFSRIQQEKEVQLDSDKGDPGKQAERLLRARIFGDHPYGRQAEGQSVSAMTPGDVTSFVASHLRPEGATVAVAGDISMPELETLAARRLGDWKASGGAGTAPADIPPVSEQDSTSAAPASGMTIEVIDMPGSLQSAIRVGERSIARDAPDYFAATVMNYVLGQMPITSRLEHNLREVHNWAYGARSSVDAMKRGGDFVAEADVQTDATAAALREMLGEFGRLRDAAVPPEELAAVKRYIAGAFVLKQQKIQSISSQVAGIELYGLPKDSLERFRDQIAAVTAEQVQAAAQAHLRAGDLQVVIAGDAAKIRAELGQIAPVTVYGVDGKPEGAPGS